VYVGVLTCFPLSLSSQSLLLSTLSFSFFLCSTPISSSLSPPPISLPLTPLLVAESSVTRSDQPIAVCIRMMLVSTFRGTAAASATVLLAARFRGSARICFLFLGVRGGRGSKSFILEVSSFKVSEIPEGGKLEIPDFTKIPAAGLIEVDDFVRS